MMVFRREKRRGKFAQSAHIYRSGGEGHGALARPTNTSEALHFLRLGRNNMWICADG